MAGFENFCPKILSSKLFKYVCLIWGPGKFKNWFTTQECKYDSVAEKFQKISNFFFEFFNTELVFAKVPH